MIAVCPLRFVEIVKIALLPPCKAMMALVLSGAAAAFSPGVSAMASHTAAMRARDIEMQQLRVGVIGTGCIGLEHLRNLNLVDSVAITAISDNFEASRTAAMECLSDIGVDTSGVEVHEKYTDLLTSPEVDAVVICTPNDHHIEVVRHAFKTGKHCLVEKPLCTDVAACAEAEALADVARAEARAAGRPEPVLWCGMEYRYIPTIAKLISEAESGAIGSLKMLTIREHRFPFLRKVRDWNRFTERTGGTLVEKCCHFFDLMRVILRAEPVRVVATGGHDVNHKSEVYDGRPSDILDNAYVIVDFDNGAKALLEICMFAECSKHQEEISLVGTHGKLEAFAPSHGVKTFDPDEPNFRKGVRNPAFLDRWDYVDPPPPADCGELTEAHVGVEARLLEAGNHCGATYEEVKAFADAALGALPPTVTLGDGSKAVLLGLAAHRSIDTGMPVMWSDMLAEFGEAQARLGGVGAAV